jgi:hypothetical protein
MRFFYSGQRGDKNIISNDNSRPEKGLTKYTGHSRFTRTARQLIGVALPRDGSRRH